MCNGTPCLWADLEVLESSPKKSTVNLARNWWYSGGHAKAWPAAVRFQAPASNIYSQLIYFVKQDIVNISPLCPPDSLSYQLYYFSILPISIIQPLLPSIL